nr:reverse transcriptase domain-containing protein [Tanacetum cinerariifolium]
EPEDVIEVEETVEPEDETIPASVHEVDGACIGQKEGKAKDGYYGKLILDLGNGVRFSMEEGTAAMENLVKKLGNAEERAECKKLKKELEEARFSNTLLRMQNERSVPMTQAVVRRMIKESVDADITTKRARQANVRNDARGFGPVRGQDATLVVRECSFDGFMKCNPTIFREGKRVKFDVVTLQGPALTWWNSKNNQKQGNARAMTTALTEGKVSSGSLLVCEHCFTRHVGQCTVKCHKCGKVRHKARYCKEKSVATGANAQPLWTCFDCGEQGHTRNRYPYKVNQEEVREACGRAYAIKDVKPQGPNVVTGTFLLNNRYASVLFDSGFDRSFVDTRFSSMLDIDPVKINTRYEVELADGRVVSMNTILKGYTLNLVNHLFEINLLPIELGTFDVIIGMDWLVKHDAVFVCGEKIVSYTSRKQDVDSRK